MQGAEELLELPTKVGYIVSSEEDTPGPGFAYDKMFAPIVDDADLAPVDAAKGMVQPYIDYYTAHRVFGDGRIDWPLQMSALDTSKAEALRGSLDAFSLALTTNPVGSLMTNVRAASTLIQPGAGYHYYDLDQIAENAAALTSNVAVKAAANDVRAKLSELVVANSNLRSNTSNSTNDAAHLRGLSIEFADKTTFDDYKDLYAKLKLSAGTHWDEFLTSAANQ